MKALELEENLKKYTSIDSCPVRNVIANFSGKWALLIMCILSENETTRFSEFGRAIPDISPKVLTETLKKLEADGLVHRELFAEIPPKVEYSLTKLGQSLVPHLYGLIEWAIEHFGEVINNRENKN